MKEHPIPFPTSLVRALLADQAHVTRRLSRRWMKVKAGDRLWVQETWAIRSCGCNVSVGADVWPEGFPVDRVLRRADFANGEHVTGLVSQAWRPSTHMPRWASRILLECEEDARVERLQEITEEEAQAEGIQVLPLQSADDPSAWWQSSPGVHQDRTARGSLLQLWDSLHTKPGERFDDDPEVVRVGRFHRISDRRLP